MRPKILFHLAFLFLSSTGYGQAWQKETKALSISLGAAQFYHVDGYYFRNTIGGPTAYSITTGQITFRGEFGIHDYVGLGFTTGIGGRAANFNGYRGEVNLPIGFLANFHFYQLIADKVSKNIHADKMDIYGGVSLGSGAAFTFYKNQSNRIVPLVFGGTHLGIRYYITPDLGVVAEVGFGKTLFNGGLIFKL